jgi:hypothetical protein
MAFNVAKCKVMHTGFNNPCHIYTVKGQQLGVIEERDIGVRVTKTIRETAQCAKAARTASLVLGQLGRPFHFRDRHVFVQLYMQYISPHSDFATPDSSPWTDRDKTNAWKKCKKK